MNPIRRKLPFGVGVTAAVLPVFAAWLVNALWLGRRQMALAESLPAGPSRE